MTDDTAVVRRLAPDRTLRRGVLLTAFGGWNDAGDAATGALDAIAHLIDTTTVARIDSEDFLDFQVSRPTVRRDSAGERVISWPSNDFELGEVGGRDVLVLSGSEPNLRWRTFVDAILGYAEAVQVASVVCVGALQVDTPHTRPVPLTGQDTDGVLRELGVRPSDYEGPTGITGVLTQAAAARGFQTASLWAGVPHYLAGTTYATAAHALATVLTRALGVDIDLEPLSHAASEQITEIADVVAADEDLSGYVSELEERVDEDDDLGDALSDLRAGRVTGDELAAAFERYLRDSDERGGPR